MSNEVRARELLAERQEARASKDFARADALRDEIAKLGFDVKDAPTGAELVAKDRFQKTDPSSIPNELTDSASLGFTFHALYEGFPKDLERFLDSLQRHDDLTSSEVVIVDNNSNDGDAIQDIVDAHEQARAIHLDRELGWAAARNAGLKTSKGKLIVLVDLSIEATGPIFGPLEKAFQDTSLGVAGPFGLVSENMRLWADDPGPEVDAVEGYLMAIRRDALKDGLIDEKFKWYRNADIDLSFQVRAQGYQARVVPLPVTKHTHRGWDALDEEERNKRSKRNHYVFFDRWKARHDLLLSHQDVPLDE